MSAQHHEGFEVVSGIDGEATWVIVPAHSDENRLAALDEVEHETGYVYALAVECWMAEHHCPDDCADCVLEFGEASNRCDEQGGDEEALPVCFCHEFDGGGYEVLKEHRAGAVPGYHIEDADA